MAEQQGDQAPDLTLGQQGDQAPDLTYEQPVIQVSLLTVSDTLYDWVAVGAEEEGVPCQRLDLDAADVVALAYAAAKRSRLGVGVGIDRDRVVVHEAHMPAAQPVLIFALQEQAQEICRLAGCNAARLVIRLPLRFAEERTEIL